MYLSPFLSNYNVLLSFHFEIVMLQVEQIFNLTSDPVEEEDQIKNPDYAEIYKELKARHDELRDVVAQERTKL